MAESFLVSDARQRSRIAEAQRELHSAVGSLRTAGIMATTSPREERDLRKAHALCSEAEELLGDLMMTEGEPCAVCSHEFAEHDDGPEQADDEIPCKLCKCRLFKFAEEMR